MAGDQTNNLQVLDASSPFGLRSIESTDVLQIGANVELTGGADMLIDGDLTVKGTTFTVDAETVKIADNHLYLNANYELVVAQTGGLVVNFLPTATNDTVAATGFVAGVAAVSNPTVNTVGAATFSVGQFIQFTGTDNEGNTGLFEVLSHAANLLTIRGVGTTGTVEDFTQNQFITDTVVAGTIRQVNVSVMRSGTDGAWETGQGLSTPITFTDLATGGNTLQQAYVAGNTITTSAPEGDVIIAGTEALNVTTTGGINLDTVFDADVTTFDVVVTGAGFSIDADTASNVSTTGAELQLSTITSGELDITSAGLLDINAAANIDIDVTGTFDMLSTGAFSIDGTGGSNVGVDTGDLTLRTTTSGNVVVNAADNVDIDGANVQIDATSTFSIDGALASNVTVTGAALTLSTVTSGDVVVNSAGDVDIDGANILLDATAGFSIDGAALSNMTVTGANLQIRTATTGEIQVSSVANVTVDGTGVSIDGTAASNVSVTAANLTLSTITSGSLLLTSAGDSTYTVPNGSAAAFLLTDGTDNYLRVDSTDNALEVLAPFTDVIVGGLGVPILTDSSLVAGDIVQVVTTTGNVALADADTGNLTDALVIGISQGTFGSASVAQIFTMSGGLFNVRFTAAPAAALNGDQVFLSTTAGQATMTAPSGATTTVYAIGILVGGDGATTTPTVLYQPRLVSRGPQVS